MISIMVFDSISFSLIPSGTISPWAPNRWSQRSDPWAIHICWPKLWIVNLAEASPSPMKATATGGLLRPWHVSSPPAEMFSVTVRLVNWVRFFVCRYSFHGIEHLFTCHDARLTVKRCLDVPSAVVAGLDTLSAVCGLLQYAFGRPWIANCSGWGPASSRLALWPWKCGGTCKNHVEEPCCCNWNLTKLMLFKMDRVLRSEIFRTCHQNGHKALGLPDGCGRFCSAVRGRLRVPGARAWRQELPQHGPPNSDNPCFHRPRSCMIQNRFINPGTWAGTRSNQKMMMEQNPFPDKRETSPGTLAGTRKSWWNKAWFLEELRTPFSSRKHHQTLNKTSSGQFCLATLPLSSAHPIPWQHVLPG